MEPFSSLLSPRARRASAGFFPRLLPVIALAAAALSTSCQKSSTPAPPPPVVDKAKLEAQARAGDRAAQNELGDFYAKGPSLNYTQAYTWYRAAADQGSADGQYNVATLLEVGQGVKRDEPEAVRWYLKAAEQGHSGAQHNLGSIYASGRGVPQNSTEAAKWFRLAAEAGDPLAQYNLGQRYELDRGVAKDLVAAYKWHSLAAAQGIPDAADARARIKPQLNSTQLAEAEKQVKEFRPAKQIPK